MPYGDINLGQYRQYRLKLWRVAWRHQAITGTIVHLSFVQSSGIYPRGVSDIYPWHEFENY